VINREINLAIIPTGDLEQWGIVDRVSASYTPSQSAPGGCAR
jgi:hypothetical protein